MVERIAGVPVMRPYIDEDNKAYWDAVKQHRLVLQRCSACERYLHPPRPMCPYCHSRDSLEWAPSQGKGHVYSFVAFETDRMAYPAFKIPYAVVLVELEEGPRMTANTTDIEAADVYIGMPVQITFEEVEDDMTLYRFKRRET